MNNTRNSKQRLLARLIPGILISIIALVIVFRMATWKDIGDALVSVKPLNFGIAVILNIIALGTRSLAWRALLNRKIDLCKTFFIINEGYFLNNIFPFRAGEFGRAILMGRVTNLGPYHVLSTIVIERALDLAIAAGLLLSTIPLALDMEWARPIAILTLILVISGLIVLYLISKFSDQIKVWSDNHSSNYPFINKFIIPKMGSLLDGFSALNNPKFFLESIFWLVVSWFLWVFVYYITLISFAPQAKFWWAAFIDSVLALGVAIPSAPASLGVFEAALVGALKILGAADPSQALAYAIVMHFMQFAITGILGGYGLIKEGMSLSTLFSQIQSQK